MELPHNVFCGTRFADVPDIDDEFPLNAETIVSSPFFKTSPKLSNLVSIQRVLLWLLAALDLRFSFSQCGLLP